MDDFWPSILALLLSAAGLLTVAVSPRRGRLAALVAVAAVCSAAAWRLLREVGEDPAAAPSPLDWTAWGAACLATLAAARRTPTRWPPAAAYGLSLAAWWLALGERVLQPPRLLAWTAVCEWAALVLLAALVAWLNRRFSWPRPPRASQPAPWFLAAQAVLLTGCAGLTLWIAVDPGFDGMGEEVALLGLAGRRAACPAALMLLGAAILMAWQTGHRLQAWWQYASLVLGLLFTTSVGWSGIVAAGGSPAWRSYVGTLAVTATMMTCMSGWGLARGLSMESRWVARGRRAMPFFASLAVGCWLLLIRG